MAEWQSTISDLDRELIGYLDQLVFADEYLRGLLLAAFERAQNVLRDPQNTNNWACEEVDIAVFKTRLPEPMRPHINLCRVFLLKSGNRLAVPEVHRNSIQRLVAFQNRGTMHIAGCDSRSMKFQQFHIGSLVLPVDSDLGLRWNIVPANMWHFPEAASDGDWCTITFHSASADTIIDEDWSESSD